MKEIGKYIVFLGGFAIMLGLLLWWGGDQFKWFGRLPGDIRIEKEHFQFYAPITSMILVSIVLSLLLFLVQKILK